MSTLFAIILASLTVSLISFVGGFFLFWKHLWTDRFGTNLVSFAAGTMLAAAFLDLLPEAQNQAGPGADIFAPILLGVMLFFFLERFILWFHHHDSTHQAKPTTVLILVGDAVHNVIDGVAIAAAFLANPGLGVITTLAIAAHEVPQEVADLSVLIHGGLSKRKALLFNFLSGLTALIGAVGSFYFLEKLSGVTPILLSFTAGMFIYIACSDLIPEMHQNFKRERGWMQSLPFVLGVLVLWAIITFLEH